MSFWLTLWKSSEEDSFLSNCPSQVLQQKLKDLEKAFKDCFDKKQPLKRIPRWRKKAIHNSFRYPQGFKISGIRIFLPKIGWVNFFNSRGIVGIAKNVTVSKTGNNWYISIQTELEIEQPIHTSTSQIGINLGITKFTAFSNGQFYESVKSFEKNREKLAKAQRLLKRKKRFSQNWKREVKKISNIHTKIANTRMDHLHKLSTEICKNHAIIFVEDLKIANMSKSAKGDLENHGTNIKAKTGLNRSILDQGWGEFRRQLKYKSLWVGGETIEVRSAYTSQSCSACGNKSKSNRISQERFHCQICDYKENADINAAKNILAAGQAAIACGEIALVTSTKQELLGTSNSLPA
ncbi:unnamed protein product [Rotaria magnacalcarata]|uniref:Transposase n=1 Tax=Rotaria magnacalcarata TaxID=392030 RepID=A0A817A8U6_9BILA|nr:unnamed protein product [Rotaria magnacalcarata]CAF3761433.1 unnamed protein product [Rotaria magnacalcarata]